MAMNRAMTDCLDWPFFEPRHRAFARELDAWAARRIGHAHGHDAPTSTPPAARSCARSATPAGCAHAVAGRARRRRRRDRHARDLPRCARRSPATTASPTSRSRCRAWARARSASPARPSRRRATCRAWRAAKRSPRSRCPSPTPAPTSPRWQCAARADDGDGYVLDGEKTWISNGGIADFYVVFARTGEATRREGARGICAFIVDADTPGFEIAERIDVIAPHPLARLRFNDCRIPRRAAHRRRRARASRSRCARSTSSAPRSPPRRSASRGARSTRRWQRATIAQDVRPGVLGDFQLTQAKLAQMAHDHRQRRAAHLPRRLAARPGRATSRARRRWPSSPPPKARSR